MIVLHLIACMKCSPYISKQIIYIFLYVHEISVIAFYRLAPSHIVNFGFDLSIPTLINTRSVSSHRCLIS